MSAAGDQANNFPTMIIPRGTEIKLNSHGQLSIKTPGNLVIQNSGNYSEIESTSGSIRIEENVSVEAVSVRAGQACYIQGTLTAWKVHAKRISLEDRAKAFIMVQESEHLELSKSARLVGNFANEKELYLMMSKFTGQLRELPGAVDMHAATPLAETRTAQIPAPAAPAPADPDQLRTAQTILDREVARPDLAPQEAEALREVLFGLRERNLPRVASTYREAFGELRHPSEALRKAYENLDRYFAASRPS
ncbi:MAG TPA: hypothetical protein VLU46_03815 [Thermoanaerobaculia bacterium]|nr:hypothetical protein [Thermoanaerobaculia bacterium]